MLRLFTWQQVASDGVMFKMTPACVLKE